MILNISKWRRAAIPLMKIMVERDRANQDPEELITRISTASGVHIVAIATFYIEAYGSSPDLEKLLTKLSKYYGIQEIRE